MCILKPVLPTSPKVLNIKNRKCKDEQPLIVDAPSKPDESRQQLRAQKAWVMGGCATLLLSLAKTLIAASSLNVWVKPAVASLLGYILADLVSGLYHWAIDNYGNPSTPIFGNYIVAFQDHHKRPWTITKPHFTFNIHILAKAVIVFLTPFCLTCNDPTILAFVTVLSGFDMIGLQIHAWSHETKSKLPRAVVALQDLGVFMCRSKHAPHHEPPHNRHYCVVSGLWNEFLDNSKVFDGMEMGIFHMFGVKPRSWDEDH